MRSLVATIVLCASCAAAGKIVRETRSCAEPLVAERLPPLLPVVLAVLDTGTQSVHDAAMSALEAGIEGGRDVLVCAVDAVLGEVEALKTARKPGATAEKAVLEARAAAYLASRGFTHRAPLGTP